MHELCSHLLHNEAGIQIGQNNNKPAVHQSRVMERKPARSHPGLIDQCTPNSFSVAQTSHPINIYTWPNHIKFHTNKYCIGFLSVLFPGRHSWQLYVSPMEPLATIRHWHGLDSTQVCEAHEWSTLWCLNQMSHPKLHFKSIQLITDYWAPEVFYVMLFSFRWERTWAWGKGFFLSFFKNNKSNLTNFVCKTSKMSA